MEFLNFVMALSPIIVVLVGILGFRQSAKKVAPVALIWTLVLAPRRHRCAVFGGPGLCHYPGGVHGADHALHLRAVSPFRDVINIFCKGDFAND